jgi:hypothetical protein
MATARRSQELSSWRQPIDIASLVWAAREELPALYLEGRGQSFDGDCEEELVEVMLEDDPVAILDGIKHQIRTGAPPEMLGSTVAHAAFLRMARFHTSNEFADWDRVHNTLTAANALHQALKRTPSVELLRGVFDTGMSVYLDRFLNMPSRRLPGAASPAENNRLLLGEILERTDVQQQVEEVAQLVSRHLEGGDDGEGLLATLGHVMLREDSGFHSFQLVDAGFKQYAARRGTESGRRVLIGTARFLAAHSPTSRAVGQTYQVASRLHRGEELFKDS